MYIMVYLKAPPWFLHVAHLTLHVSELPGEAGLQGVGHGGVEGGGHLLLTALLVFPLGEHAGLVYILFGLLIESYVLSPVGRPHTLRLLLM